MKGVVLEEEDAFEEVKFSFLTCQRARKRERASEREGERELHAI